MPTTIIGASGIDNIQPDAVVTADIQNSAVTTAKVADANVTAATLSGAQTGSAPVFGARAWCVFNGTTAGTNAPTAGGNVTSVTRNGTGDYTINFTTAMPDTSYAVVATGTQGGSGNQGTVYGELSAGTRTTSAIQIRASQGTANIDAASICVAIFR